MTPWRFPPTGDPPSPCTPCIFPGGEPTLLCQDPVGAWAGVEVDGDIVYGTWRSSGFTLMEKEAIQEAAPAAQEKRRCPACADSSQCLPPPAIIDWPRFDYWTPLPFYLSSIASGELVFAPGVLLGAFSNLESTSLTAALSFRTDWLQPAIELGLETRLGTATVSYLLSEGFTTAASGTSSEELQQQLALSFPLVSSTAMRTTTSLVATTGIVDSLSLTGGVPFTFVEGFNGSAGGASLDFAHDLGVAAGLAFLRMTSGSDLDLFARNMLAASASTVIYPPVVSDTGLGAFTEGLFSFAFPSPVPHQVIKLGLKASYSTFPWPFYQVTNPRGDFDPVVQVLPGEDASFPGLPVPHCAPGRASHLCARPGGLGRRRRTSRPRRTGAPLRRSLLRTRISTRGMEVLFVFSVGEGTYPFSWGRASGSIRALQRRSTGPPTFDRTSPYRPTVFPGTGLLRTAGMATLVRRPGSAGASTGVGAGEAPVSLSGPGFTTRSQRRSSPPRR